MFNRLSPVFSYTVLFNRLVIQFERLYHQGPDVQSIISLTSSLRGHFVKLFMTLLQNTLIFFAEKLRVQKLLTFFSTKNFGAFEILTFEILTSC